jgi:hypothetical protein
MERRSLIVYFDMRLGEDRELLQRLRPYIVSRRGNEFIKAAIREKFDRVAGSQPRTAAFGSSPPPNGGLESPEESRVPPVLLAQEPVQEPATVLGDRTDSEAVHAAEVVKPVDAADAHGASPPEVEAPVEAVAASEPSPQPRPRLGRLM